MPAKLYSFEVSPPCHVAMMGCELFGVETEIIELDLLKKENRTPEFLKINPIHTVPVLEDGDVTVIDSHAILMYLADAYGKNDSLYPKDIKKRTVVNQILFIDSATLFPRVRNVTYDAIKFGRIAPTESQLKDIDDAYGYVEEFLTRTKFIAGDDMTIADLAIVATVSSLNLLLSLDVNKYPKIAAWIKTLEKEPFYKKYNVPGNKIFRAYIESFLVKS